MAGPLRLYLDAWDAATPEGTALGQLVNAYEKKIQDTFNCWGIGSFTINRHDADAAYCETGNLIRASFVAGGPFAYDSPNYFFAFYIEAGEDETVSPDEQGGDEWHRGGRGILSVLDRNLWWLTNFMGSAGPVNGKWQWFNDQYGDIFKRGLDEWNARPSPKPIPPTIPYDFSSTLDSDGVAWPSFSGSHAIEVGTDYLTGAMTLAGQGLEIAMDPDFTTHAWITNGRGTNRSSSVAFRKGWNIREAGTRHVYAAPRGTRALVKGDATAGAVYLDVTDGSTSADESGRWGRRELFVPYETTADTAPLTRAGQTALEKMRKLEEGPVIVGVTSYGGGSDGDSPPAVRDHLPYTDYEIGDIVTLDVPGEYDNLARRIYEISLEEDENGEVEVDLTLGQIPFDPDRPGGCSQTTPAAGMGGGGHTHVPGEAAPAATFGEVSFGIGIDNLHLNTLEYEAGSNWIDMAADLPAGAGTEYDIYDVDADAVCGATTQYRVPMQTFAATLLTFTSVGGEPVRARIDISWSREDPPLGPRPQAKQWMPILVTVQPLTAGLPVPGNTLYKGVPVAILNSTANGGTLTVRAPVGGSGATRRILVVFRPLWKLVSSAICGHPDDWGASLISADNSGSLHIALEEISSPGFVEVGPLGTFDGTTQTFDLAGAVAEVEWIQKNGLELPDTEWSADLGADTVTFVTPPKATDLVVVRYRVE